MWFHVNSEYYPLSMYVCFIWLFKIAIWAIYFVMSDTKCNFMVRCRSSVAIVPSRRHIKPLFSTFKINGKYFLSSGVLVHNFEFCYSRFNIKDIKLSARNAMCVSLDGQIKLHLTIHQIRFAKHLLLNSITFRYMSQIFCYNVSTKQNG